MAKMADAFTPLLCIWMCLHVFLARAAPLGRIEQIAIPNGLLDEFGIDETTERKWEGAAAQGGILYFAPFNANGMLALDATTRELERIDTSQAHASAGPAGEQKEHFYGLVSQGGKLVAAPYRAEKLIEFDPVTSQMRFVDVGNSPCPVGSPQWVGIAALGSNKVVAAPYQNSCPMLIYNIASQEIKLLDATSYASILQLAGGIQLWSGGAKLGGNKAIFAPFYNKGALLITDDANDRYTIDSIDVQETTQCGFGSPRCGTWNTVAVVNDRLFFAPKSATAFLAYDLVDQTFSILKNSVRPLYGLTTLEGALFAKVEDPADAAESWLYYPSTGSAASIISCASVEVECDDSFQGTWHAVAASGNILYAAPSDASTILMFITPTSSPTSQPSSSPTASPTVSPTTARPSQGPTSAPTASPTAEPTTDRPSSSPSEAPSSAPTTSRPTVANETWQPTAAPSAVPTASPTIVPTSMPSSAPTTSPTAAPSTSPTPRPSSKPSTTPSNSPSFSPSSTPSASPSMKPSVTPSVTPTYTPTTSPTALPSTSPTPLDGIALVPIGDSSSGAVQRESAELEVSLDARGALAAATTNVRLEASSEVPASVECSTSNGLNLGGGRDLVVSWETSVVLEVGLADVRRGLVDVRGGQKAGTLKCSTDSKRSSAQISVVYPMRAVPAFVAAVRVGTNPSLAPLALVLNGRTEITIIADANAGFLDFGETIVEVGGLPCVVTQIYGSNLTCTTPFFNESCSGTRNRACGARSLVVSNVAERGNDSNFEDIKSIDASCEECIVYARECNDPRRFAPLSVCSDAARSEDFVGLDKLVCAYGEADACIPCPVGCYCPGGWELWPKVGFWVSGDRSSLSRTVVRCAAPGRERCPGPRSLQNEYCGDGYTGYACSACKVGYFADLSGVCVTCPPGKPSTGELIVDIGLPLLGTAFALFIFAALAGRAVKLSKTTVLRSSLSFVIWASTVVQVLLAISSIGRPPGLPRWLASMFGILQLLELNFGVFRHPGCATEPLFAGETLRMSAVLTLHTILVLLTGISGGLSRHYGASTRPMLATSLGYVRRGLFMLLTVVYGTVTTTAFKLINCRSFDGRDGAWLLNYPFVPCFGNEHAAVHVLAWLTIATFSLPYPIYSFFLVMRFLKKTPDLSLDGNLNVWAGSNATALLAFTFNDYIVEKFYFLQLNCGLIFVIVALNTALSGSVLGVLAANVAIEVLITCAFACLFMRHRPFLETERWKLPIKVLSLIVAAEAAVLNIVATADTMTTTLVLSDYRPSTSEKDDGDEDAAINPLVTSLSIALVVLCGMLCVALMFGFCAHVWHMARIEEERARRLSTSTVSGGRKSSSIATTVQMSSTTRQDEVQPNPIASSSSAMAPQNDSEPANEHNMASSALPPPIPFVVRGHRTETRKEDAHTSFYSRHLSWSVRDRRSPGAAKERDLKSLSFH